MSWPGTDKLHLLNMAAQSQGGKGLHVHMTNSKDKKRYMNVLGLDWSGGIAARIKSKKDVQLRLFMFSVTRTSLLVRGPSDTPPCTPQIMCLIF